MGFGAKEILIILAIALLLFGAKKLPDLARSLGRSARILKAETKGLRDENDAEEAKDNHHQQQASQHQNASADSQQAQQQNYPQLPAGQRIVNESGETANRTYGN